MSSTADAVDGAAEGCRVRFLNFIEGCKMDEKLYIDTLKLGEFSIFCGAGISKNSGLPLANELKQYILEKLLINRNDINEIFDSNLPFEGFIEAIMTKTNVSKILDLFKYGEPNTNHVFIAKLAKYGYLKTIFTTNFDLLIEKALENEKLKRNKDFKVYSSEEEFPEIDLDNINIISIFKIHGSIDNENSIRTTLKAVASKSLSDKRKKIINYMLSKSEIYKTLLIFGYSCSDIFDITPQIQSLKEHRKEIILVEHNEKEKIIEDISKNNGNNPFKQYLGKRIKWDTNKFIKSLWNSLLHKIGNYKSETSNIEWNENINDWAKDLKRYKSFGIAGSLFNNISSFNKAIKYYHKSLGIAKESRDKMGESECYKGLGDVYQNLGMDKERIENYAKSTQIAKDIGDEIRKLGYIKKHNQIINVYQDKHILEICDNLTQIDKMMEEHKESLMTDNETERLHKTIKKLEYSLETVKKFGYKKEEAACYVSLGEVYYNLKNIYKAIEHFKKALNIAIDIGDKPRESDCYECLHRAHLSLGNTIKAKEYHDKSLRINKEIGSGQTLREV